MFTESEILKPKHKNRKYEYIFLSSKQMENLPCYTHIFVIKIANSSEEEKLQFIGLQQKKKKQVFMCPDGIGCGIVCKIIDVALLETKDLLIEMTMNCSLKQFKLVDKTFKKEFNIYKEFRLSNSSCYDELDYINISRNL